jgi:hypothetical protein
MDKRFSLLYRVQTGARDHPAPYSMCTVGFFPCQVKLTTHFYLMLKSRMMELYLRFPIRLHGVVINLAQGKLFLLKDNVALESVVSVYFVFLLCGDSGYN